jgi:RNA polymerase sigma-70 factor (ECF subfamily)
MFPAEETRQLFERARAGSPDAVNAFYERCGRKLLPLVRLRLGRSLRVDLESRDIVQNVLCKSIGRLDQVRDPGAVMAWLARMAENEIRDQADYHGRQRRDAARRAPLEEAADVPAPVRQALSQAILLEESARLATALESLPDGQRELIVLRRLEELSFPEIAARLGKSEDACRMAFSRAMAALTMKLGDA